MNAPAGGSPKIAVLRERAEGETRVAATPETVKKLVALGARVAVETGAGAGATLADTAYAEAGAEIGEAGAVVAGADIVLGVQGPDPALLTGAAPGAWVVAAHDPFGTRARLDGYGAAGLEALADRKSVV